MKTINNKIKYQYNQEENNYQLSIQDIVIILDLEQTNILNNLHHRIKYDSSTEYPYYNIRGRNTNILEVLYNTKYFQYKFRNNNKFDLRKDNVEAIEKNIINNEYLYNHLDNSYSIKFGDITIIIDPNQYAILQNLNKRLIYNSTNRYPFYNKNYKKCDLMEIFYHYKKDNLIYLFKNNNKYDLRNDNVIIQHNYYNIIENEYDIKHYIPGHYIDNGKEAYIMKNPVWITKDNDYLMYCETGKVCILCEKSYHIIKQYELDNKTKLTFHSHPTTNYILSTKALLYIHQIIMNHYGNGKGTKNGSVDHKNRNRLDNRLDNLEITTHEQQQANRVGSIEGTKRKRKTSAKPLPDDLTQDMIPKYVVYYREMYNKEKQLSREFFKIEKHPKLTKPLAGSKSNKLTILEKLEQIKQKLQQLETTTEINI